MAVRCSCQNPNCGKALRVRDELAGKCVRCPACGTPIIARSAPAAKALPMRLCARPATTTDPIPQQAAVQSRTRSVGAPHSQSRSATALVQPYLTAKAPSAPAERHGELAATIASREQQYLVQFPAMANDAAKASELLKALQRAIPAVSPIYRPSGKCPAAGVLVLAAGACVGGAAFALIRMVGGIIALFFALAVTHGMATTFQPTSDKGRTLITMAGIVLHIALLLVLYAVAGVAAAWCIGIAGKLGKNRSTTLAVLAGGFSTALAMLFMWWFSSLFAASFAGGTEHATLQRWITLECIIGGFVGVIACGVACVAGFREQRFCEDCNTFLEEEAAASVGLGSASIIAEALPNCSVGTVAGIIKLAPEADGALVRLIACPKCRCGFIDLIVQWYFEWEQGGERQRLEASWLAGTIRVTREQARELLHRCAHA